MLNKLQIKKSLRQLVPFVFSLIIHLSIFITITFNNKHQEEYFQVQIVDLSKINVPTNKNDKANFISETDNKTEKETKKLSQDQIQSEININSESTTNLDKSVQKKAVEKTDPQNKVSERKPEKKAAQKQEQETVKKTVKKDEQKKEQKQDIGSKTTNPKDNSSSKLQEDKIKNKFNDNQDNNKNTDQRDSMDQNEGFVPLDQLNQQSPKSSFKLPNINSYKPFQFNYGSSDYLPNVQDGEFTILNSKANQYAVFVRRVGERVFNTLRNSSWSSLSRSDIQNILDFAVIRATMNSSGRMKNLRIIHPSGSINFDYMLQGSLNKSFWDHNPPEDLIQKEGEINFIFKSKTWSVGANNAQMREQRWLLLGIELE